MADLNTHIRDNLNVLKTSINDNGTLKAFYPLHKASGTSTATGVTDMDTYAISGLAADDALTFYISLSQITNATSQVSVYSTTDAAVLARLTAGGTINAGASIVADVVMMNDQSATTVYNACTNGSSTGGFVGETKATTGLTAWTGSWTVGLHYVSMSGAGTLRYRWTIYKTPGA